jgi:hypothetical protein
VPVPAAARARWERLAESLYPRLRGGIVPTPAFEEALRLRDEHRRQAAVRR